MRAESNKETVMTWIVFATFVYLHANGTTTTHQEFLRGFESEAACEAAKDQVARDFVSRVEPPRGVYRIEIQSVECSFPPKQ